MVTHSQPIDAAIAGVGLYTVQEAAFYTGLHAKTIRSWFFDAEGPKYRPHSLDFDDGSKLLSFGDFVEAMYVKELRTKFKISLPVIRSAIETARDLEGIENPFAHPRYRTAVIGKSIHIYNLNKPDVMTALTHSRGQMASRVILQDFIDALEFDKKDLVKLYVAYRSSDGERVVAARDYNFGVPMIESCFYTAETLWRAVDAEGGVKEAATAYGVPESSVKVAVAYFRSLGHAA